MAMRKRTKYIVIHTTATNTKSPLTSDALRRMHRARGFLDIGYNTWVDRNGKIHRGRGTGQMGAHVRDYNSVSEGIAWSGGHKKFDMTGPQEQGLLKAVKAALKKFPGAEICGHRDLSPDADGDGIVEKHEWVKLCPWFDAEVWAAELGLPHTNFSGKAGKRKTILPKNGPDKRTRWLQSLLREEGFDIVTDGIEGKNTRKAVRQFEADNALTKTGSLKTRRTVNLLKKRARNRRNEEKELLG